MHTELPAPAIAPVVRDALQPQLHRQTLDDLLAHGWAQQNLFLPAALTLALAAECRAQSAQGALAPASVGRGAARALRPQIRGDRILWLQAGQSVACDSYLAIMESLRLALNRAFYLGLDNYESHFALYAPGAGYGRHRDRFCDDDLRNVSAVIYLNPDWPAGQGGVLRLYPEGGPAEDIGPVGSRLVLFLSADMPHEVLPATHQRLSLAGWFRRRPQ